MRDIKPDRPGTAVLMASGEDDPMIAEIASDNGAYGYMVTPLSPNQLLIGVANALYRRRLEQQNDVCASAWSRQSRSGPPSSAPRSKA